MHEKDAMRIVLHVLDKRFGWEIIDTPETSLAGIVARDDEGAIHLVTVDSAFEKFPNAEHEREELEAWLLEIVPTLPPGGGKIVFDAVEVAMFDAVVHGVTYAKGMARIARDVLNGGSDGRG